MERQSTPPIAKSREQREEDRVHLRGGWTAVTTSDAWAKEKRTHLKIEWSTTDETSRKESSQDDRALREKQNVGKDGRETGKN